MEPDPELLKKIELSPEMESYWLERIQKALDQAPVPLSDMDAEKARIESNGDLRLWLRLPGRAVSIRVRSDQWWYRPASVVESKDQGRVQPDLAADNVIPLRPRPRRNP